ncbi:MAG TPA: S-methyl-5-thioribose-1-phosphate isomerase [Polyangiaceae bacterium]|nr:S-methyl-5-thioribose-1-phosphate isomerase [Polyangiaceae bacterium]
MKVGGRQYRTIWVGEDGQSVALIDQTKLPHAFIVASWSTLDDAVTGIERMQVRGAPLIGVAAAYGVCLALRRDAGDGALTDACRRLSATRPTAVNLRAALTRSMERLAPIAPSDRVAAAYAFAAELADEDVAGNRAIGEHGLGLLRAIAGVVRGTRRLEVMTHCNAGWLATVDFGTALAPVYAAHDSGIPVHVWVSETRPRNQGASLTAWELAQHGVPYTAIVDSAAGHLMQRGDVDVVLVGTDRTTAAGVVANKIGTYMKALAARDCAIPFYVAAPSSSIDWTVQDGRDIPIEERSAAEVTHVTGRSATGQTEAVQLFPDGVVASNYGFDVTPAKFVTALITERGVCQASREGLLGLFPERDWRMKTAGATA